MSRKTLSTGFAETPATSNLPLTIHGTVPRLVRSRRGFRSRRTAFTLLEVVVGIVLLASLVSGVVMAMSAHQRKIRFARQKVIAVGLADELLATWQRSVNGPPLSSTGSFAEDGSMVWRTDVVDSRELCGVPVHVVRLNVVGATDEKATVLCSVDLVVNAKQAGMRQ